MQIASDYKDLLKLLNKHRIKYLIVGAYAVIHYTEPRYTKDFDIWIQPEENNAKKVCAVLKIFGAPLQKITYKDFMNKSLVYQIGVAPIRVDIIMGLPGMDFKKAWENRRTTKFDNIKINIINKSFLG